MELPLAASSGGQVAMLARSAHLLGDDGRKGAGGADVGRPSGMPPMEQEALLHMLASMGTHLNELTCVA